MPFTHIDLNCPKGVLNVLEPQEATFAEGELLSESLRAKTSPFDFREFLKGFSFSTEAQELFSAALKIFQYYHKNPLYEDKDYNDSFYDITNAIMGKDPSDFSGLDSTKDSRITKVKTTKGTKGFGKNTIKDVVESEYLPIFENFFVSRDKLAHKINKEALENNLLLWERENIY